MKSLLLVVVSLVLIGCSRNAEVKSDATHICVHCDSLCVKCDTTKCHSKKSLCDSLCHKDSTKVDTLKCDTHKSDTLKK
jgi:hypothetical protein